MTSTGEPRFQIDQSVGSTEAEWQLEPASCLASGALSVCMCCLRE